MTNDMIQKCRRYVNGTIRVGGPFAAKELSEKLIKVYKKHFDGYQVILLSDGSIMSIVSLDISNDNFIISGYETNIYDDKIVYGNFICASVQYPSPCINSALIKMLIAIKSIQEHGK